MTVLVSLKLSWSTDALVELRGGEDTEKYGKFVDRKGYISCAGK